MSVMYVVRHGQASFFSDNYDRLSDLGIKQSRLLGDCWLTHDIQIDEVYVGTLARQCETAAATGQSYEEQGKRWPPPQQLAGLNEYDGDSVMNTLRKELLEKDAGIRQLSDAFEAATDPHQRYRTFHRLLAALMNYYVEGNYQSDGLESWRCFHDRVTTAFDRIRSSPGHGRTVAVFTSGGPVGISLQTTLRAPEIAAVELNWRVYNASVTQYTFSKGRVSLDQFNCVAHLAHRHLRTYR